MGNELADTLVKEAATKEDIVECYKKLPKSIVKSELDEMSLEKWQRQWNRTTKEKITKEYFPIVADRLNVKINITHNFTSMVTGHKNIRFKIPYFSIDNAHLMYNANPKLFRHSFRCIDNAHDAN
jgi:hypothetical protein